MSDHQPSLMPRCPSCTSFDTKLEAHSNIHRCIECGQRFVLLGADGEPLPPATRTTERFPGTQADMVQARDLVAYCSTAPGCEEHERRDLACWGCVAALLREQREQLLKKGLEDR